MAGTASTGYLLDPALHLSPGGGDKNKLGVRGGGGGGRDEPPRGSSRLAVGSCTPSAPRPKCSPLVLSWRRTSYGRSSWGRPIRGEEVVDSFLFRRGGEREREAAEGRGGGGGGGGGGDGCGYRGGIAVAGERRGGGCDRSGGRGRWGGEYGRGLRQRWRGKKHAGGMAGSERGEVVSWEKEEGESEENGEMKEVEEMEEKREEVVEAAEAEEETEERERSSSALSPTRRLILLRHAKSSWDDPSIKDHERALSSRGRAAAASVAIKLATWRDLGWLPQLILCSDSRRTRETLDVMMNTVEAFRHAAVKFLGSYYTIGAMDGQCAEHLVETVSQNARDEDTCVMCMGHNRGWEEAASDFVGTNVELKTANAALLSVQGGETWRETFELAGFGGWKLEAIVFPDQLRHNHHPPPPPAPPQRSHQH
ncbi:hypothetical protein CBR_g31519 [Chara braunii]|uniref:Uncharacterized protein n=1 Tax=Chara braunii TaxID=69332 RepID=A0A388LFJ8_CHABU|nr:hypothetical protein CBR_g31519 [Chara braunii]|eukprot:GBG80962.1 hypothetical protein CBR_g31519 [Chara braunii]